MGREGDGEGGRRRREEGGGRKEEGGRGGGMEDEGSMMMRKISFLPEMLVHPSLFSFSFGPL
jgi:hypothetical protein